MQALASTLALTYRRFLTDFIPGLLMILVVFKTGLLPSVHIHFPPDFPSWTAIALVVVFAFPLGVIVSSLSNTMFERLCLQTEAFGWADLLPSTTMTRQQMEKELHRLWRRLSSSDLTPAEDELGTLALTTRNIVRIYGSDRVVELLDRYAGIAILCRDIALISLVYTVMSLSLDFPPRATYAAILIIALPFVAQAPRWALKFLRLTSRTINLSQRGLPRWAKQLLWVIFWAAWLYAFSSFSRSIGGEALLIPAFSIAMLALYTMMVRFEGIELLLLVQTGDLYDQLEKSWKYRH